MATPLIFFQKAIKLMILNRSWLMSIPLDSSHSPL